MNFILANIHPILTSLAVLAGVVANILVTFHQNSVAAKIQSLEDKISTLNSTL